jgi:septal ring factor EnvC (AmiA/AmiB activator)
MLRAIGVSLLLLLSAVQPAIADDDEQRLKEVQAEIKKLQSWLNDARGEYDDLNKKLQKSDKEISALVKQIDDTRARLREEQTRLKKLRSEQAQLRQLRTRHQQLLTDQVRIARQMGDEAAIQFWLAQDDPNKNQRLVRYFGYFNRARVEHLHTTITELVRLDNLEILIAGQEKKLRETDERLSRENERLASTRQQQKTLLSKLSTQMSSESERLKKRQADRKRLEELLNEVETLISNSPRRNDERPFKDMRGKLDRPLPGPILAAFGNRNNGNKSRWEGWKIGTKEGTSVRSIHHGRVVFSDWLRGFGLLIIIDHGQGYLSLYAHNQTLQRDVGSWVNGGDTIATAGQSGGQDKPALYFEIRHNGKPQDPAVWLKRR